MSASGEPISEGKSFTVIVPGRGQGYAEVLDEAIRAINGKDPELVSAHKPLAITRVVVVPSNPEITEYRITFSE